MIDEGFQRVAELVELIDNRGVVRKLDDDEIALVKLNGVVAAFINVCPHQHTPLVDRYGGQVLGENLTCPMHGWTYNLRTGECTNGSGKLKILDVKIESSAVFVRRLSSDPDW